MEWSGKRERSAAVRNVVKIEIENDTPAKLYLEDRTSLTSLTRLPTLIPRISPSRPLPCPGFPHACLPACLLALPCPLHLHIQVPCLASLQSPVLHPSIYCTFPSSQRPKSFESLVACTSLASNSIILLPCNADHLVLQAILDDTDSNNPVPGSGGYLVCGIIYSGH